MEASRKVWPKLIIKPDPKLTPEQEIDLLASKKVDFLIRSMGPTAEVLDAQSRKISGKSLRTSLMDDEIQKLRDEAEARQLREQERKARQKDREAAAEKEIIELYGENYFLELNGQRVKKLKKLDTPCPFCGESHNRPRGALIELYEWRRNHQGAPSTHSSEAPIKSESLVCRKCGRAFAFTAQVLI